MEDGFVSVVNPLALGAGEHTGTSPSVPNPALSLPTGVADLQTLRQRGGNGNGNGNGNAPGHGLLDQGPLRPTMYEL